MTNRFGATIRCGALVLLALSLGLLPPWIPAETLAAEPSPEETTGISIIQDKTKQGYPYISGGVGTDEREMMEKLGKAYNLKLSFADKTGPYLSEVQVVIEGAKGTEIVNTTSNGPRTARRPDCSYSNKSSRTGIPARRTHSLLTLPKMVRPNPCLACEVIASITSWRP